MNQVQVYEIKIQGQLDPEWSDWFEGLTIISLDNDVTILLGPLPDQTALHAILNRIRDLNLPLISVNPWRQHHAPHPLSSIADSSSAERRPST